jgi:hypothetical protein
MRFWFPNAKIFVSVSQDDKTTEGPHEFFLAEKIMLSYRKGTLNGPDIF